MCRRVARLGRRSGEGGGIRVLGVRLLGVLEMYIFYAYEHDLEAVSSFREYSL